MDSDELSRINDSIQNLVGVQQDVVDALHEIRDILRIQNKEIIDKELKKLNVSSPRKNMPILDETQPCPICTNGIDNESVDMKLDRDKKNYVCPECGYSKPI